LSVTDRARSATLAIAAPFAIRLKNGAIYDARNLRISAASPVRTLAANPNASRAAERRPGQRADVSLESADHSLHAVWSFVIRADSNYLRQELTINAAGQDLAISRVQLIDLHLPSALAQCPRCRIGGRLTDCGRKPVRWIRASALEEQGHRQSRDGVD
jgi:hypothetical protein